MQKHGYAVALIASVLAAGCTTMEEAEPEPPVTGVALFYTENEPGFEPNNVAFLVTRDFMRIDDRSQGSDYILFDRRKREIYNVIQSTKTVTVISAQPVTVQSPVPIEYTWDKQESGAVTRGDSNSQGYYYKVRVNGAECFNAVVAEGFLPDAVAAFTEFRQVLAGEHARSIGSNTDACDLAINIFYPTRHLEFGFPVREWDTRGYSRFLRDIQRNVIPEENALSLPKDFKLEKFGATAPALK